MLHRLEAGILQHLPLRESIGAENFLEFGIARGGESVQLVFGVRVGQGAQALIPLLLCLQNRLGLLVVYVEAGERADEIGLIVGSGINLRERNVRRIILPNGPPPINFPYDLEGHGSRRFVPRS